MKVSTHKCTAIAGLLALFLTGCMSTGKSQNTQPPLTAEQRAQVEVARNAMILRIQRGLASMQDRQGMAEKLTKPTQPERVAAVTSEELLAQYHAITATGGGASFNVERDGIAINEEMFIDAEGTVKRAGWDAMSGNFTYAVESFDGYLKLKFQRAGSTSQPMEVATIDSSGKNYRVTTIDGVTLVGNRYIPTSNGIVVTRGSSVFKYDIGQPLKSMSIPKGWNVAHHQKGDVDATGMLLLERDAAAKKNESNKGTFGFGGLMSAFKETQKTFGYAEIYDYALYDINNKSGTLLNMSMNSKTVTKLTNCHRKNDYVNECSGSKSYESLYNTDGKPNRLHYYWSLDWFTTKAGPMAVYNSGTKLLAVDLGGKQNLTLFERVAGVNSFSLKQDKNGNVSVIVVLGFGKDSIDNLTDHIVNNMPTLSPLPTKNI